jgi:hypothetical protein
MADIPLLSLIARDNVDLSFDLNAYMRHSDTTDWHSRLKNLYAYMFSVGYRYRF